MASQATLALQARNGGIRPACLVRPLVCAIQKENGLVNEIEWHREDTMVKYIEVASVTGSGPRFDSPLALWIAIWQRQLVNGSG